MAEMYHGIQMPLFARRACAAHAAVRIHTGCACGDGCACAVGARAQALRVRTGGQQEGADACRALRIIGTAHFLARASPAICFMLAR